MVLKNERRALSEREEHASRKSDGGRGATRISTVHEKAKENNKRQTKFNAQTGHFGMLPTLQIIRKKKFKPMTGYAKTDSKEITIDPVRLRYGRAGG